MKKSVFGLFALLSFLTVRSPAGQESYGLPQHPAPIANGEIWHELSCASPALGNYPIVGVGYRVRYATLASRPNDVIRVIVGSHAVVPHPVWHDTELVEIDQNEQFAEFKVNGAGDNVRIQKATATAVLTLQDGAAASCVAAGDGAGLAH